MNREQLNIVIIGHVDHGKSTLIGRLLADTGSLPEGKLEAIKAYCERNAKVFEYAFLLDALKEEQSQGITIDAARCFFKTEKRDYLIIDAPGHFEFIKNMVTGASRANAAIIVIDAKEGVKENTKRHGYLLSILGLENVCVAVNKMDLVHYDESVFLSIVEEYRKFLFSVGIEKVDFIPVSAKNGDNITKKSENLLWYSGKTILEKIERLEVKDKNREMPFRFFVHDVYKFTSGNDERRIIAGTIDYGEINKDDSIIFYPSKKKTSIESIEFFPQNLEKAYAGQSVGLIIKDKFYYVSSGELIVKENEEAPHLSRRFLANIFWMEVAPLILNKPYQARIGTQKVNLRITDVEKVIDATDPQNIIRKDKLERYDIGVCIVEATRPVVFDISTKLKRTSRFVLVDNFHISGCGIILEKLEDKLTSFEEAIKEREKLWEKGFVSKEERESFYKHKGKFILVTGSEIQLISEVAKRLEKELFILDKHSYFLSLASLSVGLDRDLNFREDFDRSEEIRRLGEVAHIITDAGIIFISYIPDLKSYELELLELLNTPHEIFVVGIDSSEKKNFYNVQYNENEECEKIVKNIIEDLVKREIIEYYI
ncbi:MAG: GTP-binding protein [Candidatus Omnitrophica bacterium]|nr:GTP-binding protein [Candidatus Omnitrophota bacterium]